MRKFGKNLVIFTRLALFCAGLTAGVLIAWRITVMRPLATQYGIIVCVATGLVLGFALMLSATSFLGLGYAVAGSVKNAVKKARPTDVAAVIIGVAVGGALACLFDFLVSLGLKVLSLRIILDLVFACLAAWGFSVAASKVLRVVSEDRGAADGCAECKRDRSSGYILHASALECDGIAELCSKWLISKPLILDSTVSEIMVAGEKATQAYRELVKDCSVVTVSGDDVAEYALKHGLRVIAARSDSLGAEPKVTVLGMEELKNNS